MKEALDCAESAFNADEVPVGAIIIKGEDTIIATAYNNVISNCDPTAHAEILVIREAATILNSTYLNDCILYTTLEPCHMCAHAISLSRIKSLYFGAYDSKSGGVVHGGKIFTSTSCHHKPNVIGGIMAKESASLLKKFFRSKRGVTL